MYYRTADVTVTILLPDKKKIVMPGDNITTKLKLKFPLPLEIGYTH